MNSETESSEEEERTVSKSRNSKTERIPKKIVKVNRVMEKPNV